MVKLFTRPVIKGKRIWQQVNPKRDYPDDTCFYLRWLPSGATNYKVKSLGEKMGLRLSEIARASFVPEDAKKPKKVAPKTFADFRDEFLRDKDSAVRSDGTPLDSDNIQTYNRVTKEFLTTIRRTRPSELIKQDLKDWMKTLRDRELLHSTICDYYRHVVSFLHFCKIDHKNLLSKNERPRPVEKTPEAYTAEEMERYFFNIVDALEALAFEFLLKTGAREREMSHLLWTDLNLEKNTVTFRVPFAPQSDFRSFVHIPRQLRIFMRCTACETSVILIGENLMETPPLRRLHSRRW